MWGKRSWAWGKDILQGPGRAKGRGTAHMALPALICYQTCLHQLIRANWLLGKSPLQELYKKALEVGLCVTKPLLKHGVL